MEKEQILRGTTSLPKIPPYKIPDDHEVFEGDENGTHFTFTKHFVDVSRGRLEFDALGVSGDNQGKEQIIQDFTRVFGQPAGRRPLPITPGGEIVSWLIKSP